jgi:hypothetical protein
MIANAEIHEVFVTPAGVFVVELKDYSVDR